MKPMPTSARKVRRGGPGSRGRCVVHRGRSVHRIVTKSLWFSSTWTSADRARASGCEAGLGRGFGARSARGQPRQARLALGPLGGGRRRGRGPARRPRSRTPIATGGSPSPTSRSIAAAISAGAGQDHPAVGQRQGLLRHDRLVPAVALLDVRGVEHRQERDAFVACHRGSRAMRRVPVSAAATGRSGPPIAGSSRPARSRRLSRIDLGLHPPAGSSARGSGCRGRSGRSGRPGPPPTTASGRPRR